MSLQHDIYRKVKSHETITETSSDLWDLFVEQEHVMMLYLQDRWCSPSPAADPL